MKRLVNYERGEHGDCRQPIQDEEMVKLAFRALDKDGSGQVSTTEFKHLMTHIGTIYYHKRTFFSEPINSLARQ